MVYIVYCGLTYFIPYLRDIYELPVALVTVPTASSTSTCSRSWAARPVA